MKKLLSLILPIAIIFSLTGCLTDSETTYLRKDFRKTVYFLDGKDQIDPSIEPKYEVRIDGNWYDAKENGDLTQWGQQQKQVAESSGDDGGGGGGGGC